MKNFYITTPIYYLNAEPHIGHAYTTVLADVLAGFHRLMGESTYFLTGTDEHGQKVQETAEKNQMEPQEHCDIYAKKFADTWKELNIKNDDFIRTTQERHKKIVSEILMKVYESKTDDGQDLIYTADYEGWYCKFEERYWTEKDLVDGNCPDCNRPVQKLSEKNYFFRMSYYQKWLIDYIKDHPEFIQPDFRRNEVLGFLKQPLGDLCISRPKSRLAWGIELPFDTDYVCYVWFDALINYISAVQYNPSDGTFPGNWWPAVHMIAKDILTTHSVYWPCMLKAIGVEMPKTIFAHGYWLTEGTKMSKSLGNVVDPLDLKDKYGVDAFRFYLIREMTLGQDSSFSESTFIQRYNSDLANDLGNLLSRVVKMIESYCNGKIPDVTYSAEDDEFTRSREKLNVELQKNIEKFRLNNAVEDIMNFIRSVNRYIEKNKPWELAKNGEQDRLNGVLYYSANALVHAAFLMKPIMPEKAVQIGSQLGFDTASDTDGDRKVIDIANKLTAGKDVERANGLFPRLQKEKTPEPPKPEPQKQEQYATFDDFKKLKLKIAEIVEAEKVPDADKLLKLQLKIGKEQRQIIAGIAKSYSPDQLIGKKIVVIVNLEPATIRGVESNGMLLAASNKGKLTLLTIDDDIDSGAKVG